jgi:hypothetical protein
LVDLDDASIAEPLALESYDEYLTANVGRINGRGDARHFPHDVESMETEEPRFSVWHQGDRIAIIDQDDVAGARVVNCKCLIQPSATTKSWAAGQLRHSDGADYIGLSTKRASSVGPRGQSKWVQPKESTPGDPQPEKDEFKWNTQASWLSTTIITHPHLARKTEIALDYAFDR